jgi:hypothetical protein
VLLTSIGGGQGGHVDRPALHHPLDRGQGAHRIAGERNIDGLLGAEPDRLANLKPAADHLGAGGFDAGQVKLDPARSRDHDQNMVHGSEIADGV